MSQEAVLKNKAKKTHLYDDKDVLRGEIARLRVDLDRLHRERDAFQRQCAVMAEENQQLEQDSKRLTWMIQNYGRVHFEFNANCYVTFIWKNEFKSTIGSDDTRVEIDRAMEMCK